MVLVAVETDAVFEVVDDAVGAHANEAGATGVLEYAVVLAFTFFDYRPQDHQAFAGRQLED